MTRLDDLRAKYPEEFDYPRVDLDPYPIICGCERCVARNRPNPTRWNTTLQRRESGAGNAMGVLPLFRPRAQYSQIESDYAS